jgi:hypothetical protein
MMGGRAGAVGGRREAVGVWAGGSCVGGRWVCGRAVGVWAGCVR